MTILDCMLKCYTWYLQYLSKNVHSITSSWTHHRWTFSFNHVMNICCQCWRLISTVSTICIAPLLDKQRELASCNLWWCKSYLIFHLQCSTQGSEHQWYCSVCKNPNKTQVVWIYGSLLLILDQQQCPFLKLYPQYTRLHQWFQCSVPWWWHHHLRDLLCKWRC